MKKIILYGLLLVGILAGGLFVGKQFKQRETEKIPRKEKRMYKFPDENQQHEGTWLTWPHSHTYGKKYANSIEYIWIDMVKALSPGEKVHIVAYDNALKDHIEQTLQGANCNLKNIDFVIAKSDDVWARDTGPMFVYDSQGKLTIADFSFDGWGKKTPYKNDDAIPKAVARQRDLPVVDISSFVLEGGSVEISKDGTVMATRSSVVSKHRNPKLNQQDAEKYFKKYLGATNFIWLDGVVGEDITDAHIDGFARFYNNDTILTVPKKDFFDLYENIKDSDYRKLRSARNASGKPYQVIEVPLTAKNVTGLDYKGSYLNYYLENKVLLLPVYGDSNDRIAIEQMAKLYPNRRVVPINVAPLYKNGGMLHCVTQQEPFAKDNH